MTLLRRYSWWIAGCAVLCVAVAWIVSASKPAQYTSVAGVDVEASAVPYSAATVVNMATEEQVASSGVVLDQAAARLGMTATDLAPHISTSVKSAANVLSIACTMPDPTFAYRCASAVTRAYVNFRNDVYATPRTRSRDPLTATLVTPAQVPTGPSGLRPAVLLLIAALVGLLLGAGTALIRDRADDRIRDRDDLQACMDAPVLATVPGVADSASAATAFTAEPDSAAAEAYRYLCTHMEPLIGRASAENAKVVLVTGAQRGDGRSSVASNLAAALAQSGSRVLLVDTDVRQPSLGPIFGVGARAGFSDLLAGDADLTRAAAATGVPGLALISAGRLPGRPGLLNQANLHRAMAQMRAAADVVILDSGPALAVSDPLALARCSDLILQVASVRSSRRQAVRAAAQELRAASGATLMGVLIGRPRPLALASLLASGERLSFSRAPADEHANDAEPEGAGRPEYTAAAKDAVDPSDTGKPKDTVEPKDSGDSKDAADRLARAPAGGRR